MAAEEQENDARVEEYCQELFLGDAVYPQDKGELQVSLGHFWHESGETGSTLPVLAEYGLTDRLQVAVALPTTFERGQPDGLGNVAFEVYWNFLNNRDSGWASGAGFAYSLPAATAGAADDSQGYEPFFILYRDFGGQAVNFSASVDVESPRDQSQPASTSGDLAAAYLRQSEQFPVVWLLETSVGVEPDGAPVRLAPGAYLHPAGAIWELGGSLPIGLNRDAPSLGASILLTFEFGGSEGPARVARRTSASMR